jgi:hypothetical protein
VTAVRSEKMCSYSSRACTNPFVWSMTTPRYKNNVLPSWRRTDVGVSFYVPLAPAVHSLLVPVGYQYSTCSLKSPTNVRPAKDGRCCLMGGHQKSDRAETPVTLAGILKIEKIYQFLPRIEVLKDILKTRSKIFLADSVIY